MPENQNKKNPNQLDKDQDKQRQGQQGGMGGRCRPGRWVTV
jgi:hypothetical protein